MTCLGPSLSMSYAKPDGAGGSIAVRSSSTATIRATACTGSSPGRFAARVITPLGDVATVWLGGPGDVFGLITMVNPEQRRTATVVALEPAETLAIRRSAFKRLQAAHPEVRDAVDQVLAARWPQQRTAWSKPSTRPSPAAFAST